MLRPEVRCPVRRLELQRVASLHLQDIVQQLLDSEGVQDCSTWLPVVVRLATTAAGMVSPMAAAAAEGGSIDPRRYIKVRCDCGHVSSSMAGARAASSNMQHAARQASQQCRSEACFGMD